jgi:DNA-binding transcriptional MerR regulator
MRPAPPAAPTYSLDDLASAAGLPRRTVRYYIQLGLLDRAEGETRAARYGAAHLEQLIAIRRWSQDGLSLERIRDLLARKDSAPAPASRPPGTVEMWSHLVVADGLEVMLEAGRAGLTPDEARAFFRAVRTAYAEIRKDGDHGNASDPPGGANG